MEIELKNLTLETYREAASKGLTFSSYLEMNDPSPENSKIDAFGRLLKEAGIITQSIPEKNIFASNVEAFYTKIKLYFRSILQEH